MQRLLIMVPLLFLSIGCGGQEMIPMKGKLVYTPGYRIFEFDLTTRKEQRLTETTSGGQSISSIDAQRFLIGTELGASSTVQKFDANTLSFGAIVARGEKPVYIPKHHKLFYFAGNLYLVGLDNSPQSAHKVAEGSFSYSLVIPVSDDEVVFPIAGDAGKTPPYRYNLVTDKLDQLPFTRQCTPYVWRSASKQLLCGVDGTGKYYLIGLDGQRMTPVDFSGLPSKMPIPLLYIPKFDVLILTVARTKWLGRHAGEHFDLWAYSFKDRRSEKLLEDNAPGRGGIVWVDQ